MGHTAAELHSNKSLSQRRDALDGFKNGKYRVLVATDIASRGIDVKGIELVLNYDLPMGPEDYVHRIGRTGRAGGMGHAISFATSDQKWTSAASNVSSAVRPRIPPSRASSGARASDRNVPPRRSAPTVRSAHRTPTMDPRPLRQSKLTWSARSTQLTQRPKKAIQRLSPALRWQQQQQVYSWQVPAKRTEIVSKKI